MDRQIPISFVPARRFCVCHGGQTKNILCSWTGKAEVVEGVGSRHLDGQQVLIANRERRYGDWNPVGRRKPGCGFQNKYGGACAAYSTHIKLMRFTGPNQQEVTALLDHSFQSPAQKIGQRQYADGTDLGFKTGHREQFPCLLNGQHPVVS